MADDDRALVLGLKRGEASSFERAFEKYRRVIFAYVRGMLRDDGLAEDCVQDVFLELARRARDLDIRLGVKGWLFRVARNRTIDVLRKRGGENLQEPDEVADEAGVLPGGRLEASERSEALMRAIGELDEAERDIVMARFFGGLTFAEVERATGVPLSTLIWRCRRALDKLNRTLGRDGSIGA